MTSLSALLNNFVLDTADYDVEPQSMTVGRQEWSVFDTNELDGDFFIHCSWYSDDKDRFYDSELISPDDELRKKLEEVFEGLDNTISTAEDVSLTFALHKSTESSPFNSELYAQYLVTKESPYTHEGSSVLSDIRTLLSGIGQSEVKDTDIEEVNVLFSDQERNSVSSMRCTFVTSSPSDYYENVDSDREFAERTSQEEDSFRLHYPLDVDDVPESLTEDLVTLMESRFDKFVSAPENVMFEGESIEFRKGHEKTSFWVYNEY